MDVKFDKFLSGMEELRSMFKSVVGNDKLTDDGSPSMTESALENQQEQVTKPRKGAGKEKQPVLSKTGKKEGGRTTRRTLNVDQSNDNIPFVTDPDMDSKAETGDTPSSVQNVVQEVQEQHAQGDDEAVVADPTMETPGSQQPSSGPPTSTTEMENPGCPTTHEDLPPPAAEEHVEVVAEEDDVYLLATPDTGGPSQHSNSEDGDKNPQDEVTSEVSAGTELAAHAPPPTAQEKPTEATPEPGSPIQRRSKRAPRSPKQVIYLSPSIHIPSVEITVTSRTQVLNFSSLGPLSAPSSAIHSLHSLVS